MNHNKAPEQKTTIDEPDVIEMLKEIDDLKTAGRRAGVEDDKTVRDPKATAQLGAERYLKKKDREAKKVRQSRLGKMVAGATVVAAGAGLAFSGSGAETNTTDNKQNTATEQVDTTAGAGEAFDDDSVLAGLDMNIDRDGIQTDGRDLEAELNQKQGPANQ